jgi:HPt (histidine-containing phosphotransfer) domain-containing protein
MTELSEALCATGPTRGRDVEPVVCHVLDELLGMLDLDLAYLRLHDPDGPTEALRTARESRFTLRPHELSAIVEGASSTGSPATFVQVEDTAISIVFRRLGLRGDIGLLIAGSARATFPNADDDRLIDAAANLAAIAQSESRLRGERKAAAIHQVVADHPQPESPRLRLVDARAVLRMCGSQPAILEKLCEVFRRTVPEGLLQVRSALREHDFGSLGEVVHKLAGTVGAFSTAGDALAETLQDAAAQGNLEACVTTADRLEAICAELLEDTRALTIDALAARAGELA